MITNGVITPVYLFNVGIVNVITDTGLCSLYANIVGHNGVYPLFREPSEGLAFENNLTDQSSHVHLAIFVCM